MNISRRMAFALIPIALLWAGAGQAGSAGSWDGTWSGAWGGRDAEATSVTVAGKRVVSYTYQGVSHPVSSSKVTASKIVYEDQGVTVTLTRTGDKTASATLHSDQGDGTAELTRQ